ncbi:co-chaperone DjlA [Candidatus Rariloculus sp.]|uniref:co-chaperone DjlA n=1 Tax=Candidatus Rariloculus sp. TaxID=3101265 RepID=UPI003D0FFD4B
MSWWTTLVGGTLGFMIGGPIGAIIGAALGSNLGGAARWASSGQAASGKGSERAQIAFFAAAFSVMGHISKADGRVTADELRLVSDVMNRFGLTGEQRRAAQALFSQGKSAGFHLNGVLDQLRQECLRGSNIRRVFVEIQFEAAWADGAIHPTEMRVLQHIAQRLGLSAADFIEIERRSRAVNEGHRASSSLDDAYATLGVSPDAPDDAVKRAYRRMMNRHHPDKLAAKGLPDEMMKAATERTQQIKAAWEAVKAARA